MGRAGTIAAPEAAERDVRAAQGGGRRVVACDVVVEAEHAGMGAPPACRPHRMACASLPEAACAAMQHAAQRGSAAGGAMPNAPYATVYSVPCARI